MQDQAPLKTDLGGKLDCFGYMHQPSLVDFSINLQLINLIRF